ncbi:MAG: hypothetical protein ABJF88_00930 [Rhodothermales bacterium]
MSRRFPLFLVLLLVAPAAFAQVADGYDAERVRDLVAVSGPLRNIVDNLHAEGDTLWAGQQLIFTADGGQTWAFVDDDVLTPAIAPTAIVFSIDVEDDIIWVGLGFSDPAIASRPQSAAGFAYSEDGGQSWRYQFPQLDAPEDTLQVYGCNYFAPDAEPEDIVPILGCGPTGGETLSFQLPALPVIVPQQSPPFDIDFDPITRDVWVAGWASGIRRLEWLEDEDRYARDFQRVVLPPDTLDAIDPTLPYNFLYAPEIQDAEEGNNFLGFSVLVDETGTVWAGTVAGVNRSRPEDVIELVVFDRTGTVPTDTLEERAWQRTGFDGTSAGLPGNWVISIEEQPVGDENFAVGTPENPRNPVWMAVWRAREQQEQFALVVTRDGGETFEPALVGGNRFYDFAFCPDGAGFCSPSTVYAAGADGLFVSEDDGDTWRSIRDFPDRDRRGRFVRRDANVFAVATTTSALWVGTGDGLLKSDDGGATWTLFRADVPTNPETPSDRVPDVEAYAYPNPFSPNADRYVRIRYDRTDPASIRIFDFGMNLVRTIPDAAPVEQVWDGYDEDGNRVANGVYFYEVATGGDSLTGKILVLE